MTTYQDATGDSRRFGYTSTVEPPLASRSAGPGGSDPEVALLFAAGCGSVVAEATTGSVAAERDRLLGALRVGDTLVLPRLHQLRRPTSALLTLLGDLARRGVAVESLREDVRAGTDLSDPVRLFVEALEANSREHTRSTFSWLLGAGVRGRAAASSTTPEELDDYPADEPDDYPAEEHHLGTVLGAAANVRAGHG